jgi:phage portal protein BeeE
MYFPACSKQGTSRKTACSAMHIAFSSAAHPAERAVNERTAMQTTAVYACVRILAESHRRAFRFMCTAIQGRRWQRKKR